MAQVIKFASDIDGKEFDTLADQLAYDSGKRNEANIEAFLDVHYPKPVEGQRGGASRGIVKKAIAGWIAFNELTPLIHPAYEEPTL